MKTLKIGIASYEKIKERTIAIAGGTYKPAPSEPKVWFTSLESLAKVLSPDNRELLKTIAEVEPESMQHLAEIAGRAKSNLSRTLKTMEEYGLVHIEHRRGRKAPRVVHDRVLFEVAIT